MLVYIKSYIISWGANSITFYEKVNKFFLTITYSVHLDVNIIYIFQIQYYYELDNA